MVRTSVRSISSVVIFKRIAAMGAEFEALLAEAVDGSAAERAAAAHAWETFERRLPAMRDRLVAGLAQVPTDQLGEPSLAATLSTLLRISKAEASRRIGEAQELGPRAAMTGQALEPMLANTAAAQQRGQINAEQVRIIRRFFDRLPGFVDHAARESAEAQLAQLACELRPEELRQCADRLAYLLDQDGELSDEDRARRRYLIVGKQQSDGTSEIRGRLDPEGRAAMDAVLAKWAAPGMCTPDDENPCLNGDPSTENVSGDLRSTGQRNHDALKAGCEKWHCSAHLRPGGAAAQITWACSTYGAWSAPSSCPTSCRRPVRTWQCPRSSGVGPFCRRDRSIHRLRARILRQR